MGEEKMFKIKLVGLEKTMYAFRNWVGVTYPAEGMTPWYAAENRAHSFTEADLASESVKKFLEDKEYELVEV